MVYASRFAFKIYNKSTVEHLISITNEIFRNLSKKRYSYQSIIFPLGSGNIITSHCLNEVGRILIIAKICTSCTLEPEVTGSKYSGLRALIGYLFCVKYKNNRR